MEIKKLPSSKFAKTIACPCECEFEIEFKDLLPHGYTSRDFRTLEHIKNAEDQCASVRCPICEKIHYIMAKELTFPEFADLNKQRPQKPQEYRRGDKD